VPDDILDDVAASLLMQGITAHHFVTEAADIQPGQAAVVHAAAGGLGQKPTQLIKARGGTVMGIVSNAQKADAARCAGADHIVLSTGDAFVEPALDLSGGEGVHVVFDGGGETTFRASMSVLRRH
jgi:NADPH2:quinone reductase